MSKKRNDFFWLSYADLMTSLFFVMLVLFLVVFSVMKTQQGTIEEFKKIEEIKIAINSIDTSYFKYDSIYKKHILNVNTHLGTQVSNIETLPEATIDSLIDAGELLKKLITNLPEEKNISYLIIVEGQASKDNWPGNDTLSYNRARALKELWNKNNLNFSKIKNCELVIAGSGQEGVPRKQPDRPPNNQRFLIHIIPKVGVIKYHDTRNEKETSIRGKILNYILGLGSDD